MYKYEHLTEWRKDLEFFREHPNDTDFLNYVKRRVKLSDESIRNKIEQELLDNLFEQNPVECMTHLAKKNNKIPILKSKEDMWFEV